MENMTIVCMNGTTRCNHLAFFNLEKSRETQEMNFELYKLFQRKRDKSIPVALGI